MFRSREVKLLLFFLQKWMAEQKAEFEQKKNEEMIAQYQREQEMLEHR